MLSLWQQCLHRLKEEIAQSAFNQWISPLQAEEGSNGITLWAPNQYVLDGVTQDYLGRIGQLLQELNHGQLLRVMVGIGEKHVAPAEPVERAPTLRPPAGQMVKPIHQSNLNSTFVFENFVVGKSNQLAEAAAKQVAANPGGAYNPLFLYGGVGLGKTHLMHAIGNAIVANRKGANVIYLHSERFVADMVKALQSNTINEFKRFYRSVDALLIDDIQFFCRKRAIARRVFPHV